MAIPLLPTAFSVKNVASSAFGGGQGAPNVQGQAQQVNQQFVQQSKQFAETQRQNQASLTNIQNQFQGLQNQINILANGINNIAKLLQQDTVSEQNLLKQQQDQERRFSLTKIRTGRENELERRIESSLNSAISSVSSKVDNLFGNIGNALKIMFFGFLGVQALKLLKSYQEKDEKTFNDIKSLLLKNIAYGIGAIAAVKLGLPLIGLAIRKLISSVAGILFGGIRTIFTTASGKIGNFLSGLNPFKGKPPSAPAISPPKGSSSSAAPAAASGAKPGANPPASSGASSGGLMGGLKNAGKGLLGGGARLLGGAGLTAGLDIAFGEDPGTAAVGGLGSAAAAGAVSKLPLPGLIKFPLMLGAGILGQQKSKELVKGKEEDSGGGFDWTFGMGGKKENTSEQTTVTPPDTKSAKMDEKPPEPKVIVGPAEDSIKESQSTPMASMLPDSKELTLDVSGDKNKKQEPIGQTTEKPNLEKTESKSGLLDNMAYDSEAAKKSDTTLINPFDIHGKVPASVEEPVKATPEMISKTPTKPNQVVPLEEPQPNVIVAQQPQQQKMSSSQSAPAGTDVPLIPSSNPDNFYVLYSKLNYNVIE